jgi:SAM-dependent methyltransferase
MERYVIRGGREGYERLRVLAAARRASTLELFQLAGLRPGMRCVDLGCGSGDVTLDLAALAGPVGGAVGIDTDQAKLELAQEAARERGLVPQCRERADSFFCRRYRGELLRAVAPGRLGPSAMAKPATSAVRASRQIRVSSPGVISPRSSTAASPSQSA